MGKEWRSFGGQLTFNTCPNDRASSIVCSGNPWHRADAEFSLGNRNPGSDRTAYPMMNGR